MELNYKKNNNKQLFEIINKNEFLDIENIQNYIPLYNVFFDLNDWSIEWTMPIGIFGGNKVLAGEDDIKSPTFISAFFE